MVQPVFVCALNYHGWPSYHAFFIYLQGPAGHCCPNFPCNAAHAQLSRIAQQYQHMLLHILTSASCLAFLPSVARSHDHSSNTHTRAHTHTHTHTHVRARAPCVCSAIGSPVPCAGTCVTLLHECTYFLALQGKCPMSSFPMRAPICCFMSAHGGMEKLSDEAIEETLDKVVKLLAYISDKDLFSGAHSAWEYRCMQVGAAVAGHVRTAASKRHCHTGSSYKTSRQCAVKRLRLVCNEAVQASGHEAAQVSVLKQLRPECRETAQAGVR
eukprot:scaffold76476_cov22-Tisochrysis_lutea.AAC.1